jgi:D-alanyl-D-alanine carboxypeptidase/D-alanyl-D-alanine-endopeptidase (penicillin-binding protein 4)
LKEFLAEAGVRANEFHIEDGSGLSRLNLVTPAATVKLLSYMYLSEDRDGWIETLPAGGEDGTLNYRFRGASLAGRVHAKTGTLTGVTALSGYADSRAHGMLAFSFYVNNHTASSASVRVFLDHAVQLLLE